MAAGCTDLFPATESATGAAGSVLDVTAIAGLRGITAPERPAGLAYRRDHHLERCSRRRSAAGVRHAETGRARGRLGADPECRDGGWKHLCNASPAADGVPPLLALDAQVELTGTAGHRVLPLDEFITGARQTGLKPGELMTAVVIPHTSGAGRSRFLKLGARKYLVISIAMVAVRLDHGGLAGSPICRIVGRGLQPVAMRLTGVGAALIGRLSRSAGCGWIALVSVALSPISDIRADAAYRRDRGGGTLLRRRADQSAGGWRHEGSRRRGSQRERQTRAVTAARGGACRRCCATIWG